MKNQLLIFVAFVMMSFGIFGAERISVDEVANHYPWDGKVDCVCNLSGLENGYLYKGSFTLTVKKDGEKIRRTVTNAFAAVDGTCTNTFDCAALFGAGFYPNGGITVDLIKYNDRTGTPIGIVGDVLVIDVSGGSDASSYPTAELTNVDIGTFNCDVYKTDKIVLRKIPAGSYYCEPRYYLSGCGYDADASQKLSTKGFYIGVFPITQCQYKRVMGVNPSHYLSDASGNVAAQRPVEQVSWNTVRGNLTSGAEIVVSSADSFLMRIVAKTGLRGFDLPTEAQWEMAARANVLVGYGAYWNGSESVPLTDLNFWDAAWCNDGLSSMTTHAVGGKCPNLFGLYDMQGNVWELCRDIFIAEYNVAYVDSPCIESTFNYGSYQVMRGGSCGCLYLYAVPSKREYKYKGSTERDLGFRLSRTLP